MHNDAFHRGLAGRLRSVLTALLGVGLLLAGTAVRAQAAAEDLRFPGEEAQHKVVYQFNKADEEYMEHVLFSVGAMLRKYGDNVQIAVVAIGPGIHILGKRPERTVPKLIQQRVSSLAQYGVKFIACGNTMKSLGWTENDLLPFAEMTEVGAAALMELQEQGYAYISW